MRVKTSHRTHIHKIKKTQREREDKKYAVSEWEEAGHEEAPHKQVNQRQRRAELHEIGKLVPSGRPHHRVRLVADRRDERRGSSHHYRQHKRLVVGLAAEEASRAETALKEAVEKTHTRREGGGGGVFVRRDNPLKCLSQRCHKLRGRAEESAKVLVLWLNYRTAFRQQLTVASVLINMSKAAADLPSLVAKNVEHCSSME